MKLPPRWLRRIVLWPLPLLVFILYITTVPLFVIAALVISYRLPGKWRALRLLGLATCYLFIKVTVIISEKGWARVRQGHGLDLSGVVFKDGDRAGSAQECRSVDSLVIVSTEGRAFTVAVASLPDGRGMGAPLSSFVELGSGRIAHVITGRADDQLLVAKTSGYGFICKYGDLLSRQRAGKAFLTVEDGASILPLLRIGSQDHLAALADDGRLLIFPLAQMKRLAGGKGVQIIALQGRETLRGTNEDIGLVVLPHDSRHGHRPTVFGAGKGHAHLHELTQAQRLRAARDLP